MNKNLIITLTVAAVVIIIFALFANPLPSFKQEPDKSFQEFLPLVEEIDISITSPYSGYGNGYAKTITDKDEIEKILSLLENVTVDMDTPNIQLASKAEHFYYTLVLNDAEENRQYITFYRDSIDVNGYHATIEEENIEIMHEYINETITGFGTLKCEKTGNNSTEIEKYYFENNNVYHYNKTKTYTPESIKEIENYISKINNYSGVYATGNTIGEIKYSYLIEIDLKDITEPNFKEITGRYKLDLYGMTIDDLINEIKDMTCTYSFLETKDN